MGWIPAWSGNDIVAADPVEDIEYGYVFEHVSLGFMLLCWITFIIRWRKITFPMIRAFFSWLFMNIRVNVNIDLRVQVGDGVLRTFSHRVLGSAEPAVSLVEVVVNDQEEDEAFHDALPSL